MSTPSSSVGVQTMQLTRPSSFLNSSLDLVAVVLAHLRGVLPRAQRDEGQFGVEGHGEVLAVTGLQRGLSPCSGRPGTSASATPPTAPAPQIAHTWRPSA